MAVLNSVSIRAFRDIQVLSLLVQNIADYWVKTAMGEATVYLISEDSLASLEEFANGILEKVKAIKRQG